MFDAIGEGHKIMQKSMSHDEALREVYAADPMQAVVDLHELSREVNELEDKVRELERQNKELGVWNYEFQREARKLQFQLEQVSKEAGK